MAQLGFAPLAFGDVLDVEDQTLAPDPVLSLRPPQCRSIAPFVATKPDAAAGTPACPAKLSSGFKPAVAKDAD